jgi:hypothetical protein
MTPRWWQQRVRNSKNRTAADLALHLGKASCLGELESHHKMMNRRLQVRL